MRAFFEIECPHTAPEDVVLLVGSHAAIGSWDIHRAVMLETSPQKFPWWFTVKPLTFDSDVQFQFAIADRMFSKPVRWEMVSFQRRLKKAPLRKDGQSLDVIFRASWDDAKSTVTIRPSPVEPDTLEPHETCQKGESLQEKFVMPSLSFCAEPSSCEISDGEIPVVLVCSELLPWSNSGGLGRISTSLSEQLALRGHRTLSVAPMYTKPPPEEGFSYRGSVWIRLDDCDHEVRCMHKFVSFGEGKGCDYVLLDHGCYQHRPHGLYCDSRTGQDYGDNLYRFAMLSLAALEVPLRLCFGGVPYGQRVVFMSNDWQSGLLPVYLVHRYRRSGIYRGARSIHIIHNLGYQGKFSGDGENIQRLLGLGDAAAQDLNMEADLNLCKGAILCADRVLTVSPSYALEMQTPEGGFGLDDLLIQKWRAHRFCGIRNALDDDWDPKTDRHIVRQYSMENFVAARRDCKAALQKKLGLVVAPDAVVFGFVGRLTWQKGVDVLTRALSWLLSVQDLPGKAQVVLMGEGEQQYQHLVQDLEMRHRGAVCGLTGFDPILEHQMMAGCDYILMPSRYEPCGLPQMAAATYGAVVIATATGGLKDSVKGMQDPKPTGVLIQPPVTEDGIRQALREAVTMYFRDAGRYLQVQQNAMSQSFRWGPALDEYELQIRLAFAQPNAETGQDHLLSPCSIL